MLKLADDNVPCHGKEERPEAIHQLGEWHASLLALARLARERAVTSSRAAKQDVGGRLSEHVGERTSQELEELRLFARLAESRCSMVHQRGAALNTVFREEACEVTFDAVLADVHPIADLFIAQTFRDESDDLMLTGREPSLGLRLAPGHGPPPFGIHTCPDGQYSTRYLARDPAMAL
jgi:hypothetical protein